MTMPKIRTPLIIIYRVFSKFGTYQKKWAQSRADRSSAPAWAARPRLCKKTNISPTNSQQLIQATCLIRNWKISPELAILNLSSSTNLPGCLLLTSMRKHPKALASSLTWGGLQTMLPPNVNGRSKYTMVAEMSPGTQPNF